MDPYGAEQDRFDSAVMRASGRVRISFLAPAIGWVILGVALSLPLSDLRGAAVAGDDAALFFLGMALAGVGVLTGVSFYAVRAIHVTTDGLRVRNGLRPARRVAWSEVRGLSVERVRWGRARLQLDTTSGAIPVKVLVFAVTPPPARTIWPREIDWQCFPHGAGRRPVESPKDAIVVLHALFRSRGWEQVEDWTPAPLVPESLRPTVAHRLDRWKRDAA